MSIKVPGGAEPDGHYAQMYFLAPVGRRVSFYTLQTRALNLAWALRKSGLTGLDKRVAVVGAGVAGVTVACALAACGCHVTLLDEASSPIWRQVATRHRVMHPRLNLWPDGGSETLMPVTELPFLNWHYSHCDDTVAEMMRDLSQFLDGPGKRITFLGQRTVTGHSHLMATADGRAQIQLHCAGAHREGPFEIVVFCSGFDVEKPHSDKNSVEYWSADDLERKKVRGLAEHYIVSGAGDGGLIDALRLIYEFRSGKLAAEVAAAITNRAPDLLDAIRAEELTLATSKFVTGESAYMSAARAINEQYKQIDALLDRALDKRSRATVWIVDKDLEFPWLSRAAPIHKLLIAYARLRDKVQPLRGELRLETANAGRGQLGWWMVGSRRVSAAGVTEVIVRHGAAPLFTALSDTAIAGLVADLERISDASAKLYWDSSDIGTVHLPVDHRIGTPEFLARRRELLQRALRQLDDNCFVYWEDDHFKVTNHQLELDLPSSVFGVPLNPDGKWRAVEAL